jgi:hypothetical protein
MPELEPLHVPDDEEKAILRANNRKWRVKPGPPNHHNFCPPRRELQISRG